MKYLQFFEFEQTAEGCIGEGSVGVEIPSPFGTDING
jgi:hypothetical protein